MSSTYQCRTREEFESELKSIADDIGSSIRDLTDAYHTHKGSWERVYELTTKHDRVRMLIFSSVDIRTGQHIVTGKQLGRAS